MVQRSGRTLGHTCPSNLVRSGSRLVTVVELAGRRRLACGYSLPSHADAEPRWKPDY